MREDLSLDIINNTNSVIPISLLNNSLAYNTIINQLTQYTYSLGLLVPTETQVRIQYRLAGTIIWQWTNAATLGEPTIQGLVNALNTLNIATFYKTSTTAFATSNDTYEIGLITTYAPNDAVINYAWQTLDTGGNNEIFTNGNPDVNDPNPVTTTFKVAPAVGDSIVFSGTTSDWATNNVGGFTRVQVSELNSGFVQNVDLGGGVPFSYSYTANAGTFYFFAVYDLI